MKHFSKCFVDTYSRENYELYWTCPTWHTV